MTIGEAAARFGLATHVLRHWESVGLITPARVSGDRRRYGRTDLYRIAIILRSKEAGFGLEDIKEMLHTPDPAARSVIMGRRRDDLRRRIAEAQASLDLIESAMNCEHADVATCPQFRGHLDRMVSA